MAQSCKGWAPAVVEGSPLHARKPVAEEDESVQLEARLRTLEEELRAVRSQVDAAGPATATPVTPRAAGLRGVPLPLIIGGVLLVQGALLLLRSSIEPDQPPPQQLLPPDQPLPTAPLIELPGVDGGLVRSGAAIPLPTRSPCSARERSRPGAWAPLPNQGL